jgi:gluconokinase
MQVAPLSILLPHSQDIARSVTFIQTMELQSAIIFIMGVSGSGKTTIGVKLAGMIGMPFFDADDYHPEANKIKMRAGIPLNDEDRYGWLVQLNKVAVENSRGKGAIIACSALKEQYREMLSKGLESPVYWVLLKGNFDLIQARLNARKGHFMPASLLRSQFDTLEAPRNAIVIDISEEPDAIVQAILEKLKTNTTKGVMK